METLILSGCIGDLLRGTRELFHLIWLHLAQAAFLFDCVCHFNYFGLCLLH